MKNLVIVFVVAGSLISSALRAADYTEQSTGFNSHSFPPGEVVPFNPATAVSLNNIFGTILANNTSGVSEEDVYKIFISDPANFSVTTNAHISFAGGGLNNFNTQLFLFNSAGQGVLSNDDTANGGAGGQTVVQSTIPAGSLTGGAGFYYLMIAGSNTVPADGSHNSIFPNLTEDSGNGYQTTNVVGPKSSGVFNNENAVGSSSVFGNYDLVLTGAQISAVPEPSTASLIALSAVGCGFLFVARGRRKS